MGDGAQHERIAPHTAMQMHRLSKISCFVCQMITQTLSSLFMFGNFFFPEVWVDFQVQMKRLKIFPQKKVEWLFLWVLNIKPQNHSQSSQKALFKKMWYKGGKNHFPHHPFPEPKLSFKSVAEHKNKLCLWDF